MKIDIESFLQLASALSAIVACGTIMFKSFKWFDRQNQQDKDIEGLKKKHDQDIREIKEEQKELCYAALATLDGLEQLGANGNVTKAHRSLEKHMNKAAHT
ncbi:branched-chain amino acid ABC transporter permease [Anaerotignum sp.]|uniref:branched-chain amino acid ABC transporter permease n=1 Tax=Anaerotignum sp. TaxID=2039241 RepID=UPI0029D4B467|nr:branched-chain amino acid ABC transporter permease [Anaerotignum sp.]MCI6056161.1 branched-chain amino acid ABC transporter permease [Clostridia bacterium]MDY3595226.1 branched-chain amino acid ABC transporter permease [Anaerotignum sp.]